jgi:hypothetical protein
MVGNVAEILDWSGCCQGGWGQGRDGLATGSAMAGVTGATCKVALCFAGALGRTGGTPVLLGYWQASPRARASRGGL